MKHIFTLLLAGLFSSVNAIRLTLPPSDGNPDIALTGPTQVESNGDLIYNYIQLLNDYLWIAMVVIAFVVLIWMGFKLITNEAGTDGAKDVLKNGFISLGVGLVIVLFSYTIVRLVINLI